MFIFFILLFIGLFIGSFLNVIIDRLPRDENFFVGRSHCESCQHTLVWYDLVPIVSFVGLRGSCRYCHTFIGWRYPVIELTTGLAFAFTYVFLQQSPLLLLVTVLAVMSVLICIFYIDLFYGIIPDTLLIALFIFSVVRLFFLSQPIIPYFFTALGSAAFFFVLFLITKGKGMGLGDVKYAGIMGFLLGFPTIIPGLYIAFLTGAGIALILVIVGKKAMKSTIAFGPFLVIGTAVGIFYGMNLWSVFLKIFGM